MTPGPGAAPDVVIVGSASRDLAPDDPRGWRLGGAVSYGGLTLARLGVRVGMLVGVDAAGATAEELEWSRDAGAEVVEAELDRAPIFDNRETPEGRVQLCLEPGEPLPVEALPASWAGAPWWLFAPVAAELDDGWAVVPAPTARIALGWQGLLRSLRAGSVVERTAPQPSALVRRAAIVGVSATDLPTGQSEDELAALLAPDAELLVTEAEAGGRWLRARGGGFAARRRWAAIPSPDAVDPTGAGDVFLAALVAARTGAVPRRGASQPPHDDLRFAAAAASLVVEGQGMAGVPTAEAVAARLARG